jgi:DNA invertase Pin-like site-specific DNA recombinase
MRAAGVSERNTFIDKASGKDFEDRAEYQTMLKMLRKGDVVIVKSIDRLGRNYSEILEQWRYITQEVGAGIRVLDIPLLDTTANTEGLDYRFIADLMLQILCYVAEKERLHIKQRQAEGIALAQAQGKRFGRPKAEKPANWDSVYFQWTCKNITAVAAMRMLGLKNNTFYKFVADERKKEREIFS